MSSLDFFETTRINNRVFTGTNLHSILAFFGKFCTQLACQDETCSTSLTRIYLLKSNFSTYHILVCSKQITLSFSKTQRTEYRSIGNSRWSNDSHSKLKNPSTLPSLLSFLFLDYQSILSNSGSVVSSAPLSFILSTSLRHGKDAARYGPRPSYSARRSTREVHPEDLIRRERERGGEGREREPR